MDTLNHYITVILIVDNIIIILSIFHSARKGIIMSKSSYLLDFAILISVGPVAANLISIRTKIRLFCMHGSNYAIPRNVNNNYN